MTSSPPRTQPSADVRLPGGDETAALPPLTSAPAASSNTPA